MEYSTSFAGLPIFGEKLSGYENSTRSFENFETSAVGSDGSTAFVATFGFGRISERSAES
ncbi:hypothetical protein D3C83_163990 [compost metagenome]